MVDHTYSGVFDDATTYPSVFVFRKNFNENNKILINNDYELEQSRLNDLEWSFVKSEVLDIKDKIQFNCPEIKEILDIRIYYGIKTGFNKAFVINKETKNKLIEQDPTSAKIIKPLLTGRDIKKWQIDFKDIYLLYIPWKFPIENYSSVKEYLLSFKDDLEKRPEVKSGRVDWFALSRYASDYYEEFDNPKLIYPNLASKLFVVYDEDKFYTNQKCFIITSENYNLKFLGTLLSSKVLNFIFSLSGTPLQGQYYDLNKKYIEQLPIYPATPEEQQPFIEKADQMLEMNKTLQNEINSFKEWLTHIFNVEKFSQKLEKYYELSIDEFLAELKKKKVDVKNRENFTSLKEEFEKSVSKIRPLLQEIEETDNEIDQMVYELYGLTDDEIKIIEDSLAIKK